MYTHIYICFLHLKGDLSQWSSSAVQLVLCVSLVFSNQHIPRSLDRHRETILAVHAQGGVTLISCPVTSDYTHTDSLYCFAHVHTQNTTFLLSKHTAFPLFWSSCHSQSFNPEPLSVSLPAANHRASVIVPVCACYDPHLYRLSSVCVNDLPSAVFPSLISSLAAPLGLGLTEPSLQQQWSSSPLQLICCWSLCLHVCLSVFLYINKPVACLKETKGSQHPFIVVFFILGRFQASVCIQAWTQSWMLATPFELFYTENDKALSIQSHTLPLNLKLSLTLLRWLFLCECCAVPLRPPSSSVTTWSHSVVNPREFSAQEGSENLQLIIYIFSSKGN